LTGPSAEACTKVESAAFVYDRSMRTESTPAVDAVDSKVYARPPAKLPALADCIFYHSIELPGLGEQQGQWDLRPGIDAYLGPTDFSSLRVLEIGTANGFVCFELERRGADVVTVDLPESATYDTRPSTLDPEAARRDLRMIRNAFWLAHSLLSSSARVVYAHVNEIPDAIGRFDVVVLGNVLQHLRDPLSALVSVARRADSIIVTEADWMVGLCDDLPGMVLFAGSAPYSWFQVKPLMLTFFLAELGLVDHEVTHHNQLLLDRVDYSGPTPRRLELHGQAVPHFTVTARRTRAHE
jgi:SAM-dependent methyltransferase